MGINVLKNKLVAVLGYGQEGRAVTNYLIKHGVKPVLFDERPWRKWPKAEQEIIKKQKIKYVFGPDCFKKLEEFDIAFRSPGIKLSHPNLKKRISHNLSLGPSPSLGERRPIMTSQSKWFFEHCPAKIIGITGTKGKGTTASLIYEILKKRGQRSKVKGQRYLTGNIGKDQPLEFLDKLKPSDWVVYELSSFQLQDLKQSPHIGVVLMTTKEHLDYHKDTDEYIRAKEAIVKFQKADDFAIINADFKASIKIGQLGQGTKLYFSRKRSLKRGCFVKGERLIIKDVLNNNFQFSIFNFQIRGAHNLENISAGILAALSAGCSKKAIELATAKFKGLEHRLEFVAQKKGIKFYNDSFSTTPETAIAAINSFNEPLIPILGGSSKKADFNELGKIISRSKNIKTLILIGEESGRIKKAIFKPLSFRPSPNGKKEKMKILEGAKNMADIFKQIKSVAASGDVVLLSPACASFDMFDNYKDRGEKFKKQVKLFR